MKSMTTFAMLAFISIAWSGTVSALGYNLRTVPSSPQAGAPFVAAFDSNICEAWVLPPQGEPPVVTVEGSTVRLEVDRVTFANCMYLPRTDTLSVPALPTGNYQLELIARAYQSPGNDIFAEAVSFQVGPAVTVSTLTIPASSKVALAMLIGLILSLGYTLFRRRA